MRSLSFAPQEFTRFGFIGMCTTAIHYLVLVTLYSNYDVSVLLATSVAFVFAVIFSYTANRRFTFKSDSEHQKSVPKFLIAALLGLALNITILHVLVERYGVILEWAFCVTTTVVMISNYLFNKLWVFSSDSKIYKIKR